LTDTPYAPLGRGLIAGRQPLLARARIWLFCAICFALPMKASFVYTLSVLLLLVWLAEGKLGEKARDILGSRLCLAFAAYCLIVFLSILWTKDTSEGWRMARRQFPLLLFMLYWSSADPRYRERYISAFLAGLCVCALLAHYNWIQLYWFPDWPRGIRVFKGPDDTAPFVDRIMYAPLLALGAYFSLRRVTFAAAMPARILALAIAALLVSNLLISGGRAGVMMFAALCIALAFERIKARARAALLCAVLLPIGFVSAYGTSNYFAQRVDAAVTDFRTFNENPATSVGLRIVYGVTSFRMFMNHPFLGVGGGDFEHEYGHNKPQRWQATADPFNPHNQFLMTAATTGLLGLAALFCIVYFAVRSRKDVRTLSMLAGFAVVCLFESYLWRSNTALAFAVLMAVLTLGRGETRTG
jgi:O-antigen ligase